MSELRRGSAVIWAAVESSHYPTEPALNLVTALALLFAVCLTTVFFFRTHPKVDEEWCPKRNRIQPYRRVPYGTCPEVMKCEIMRPSSGNRPGIYDWEKHDAH